MDELKQKDLDQVVSGKTTLCLAVASLEEAGATDLDMEGFFVDLPGGENLAIGWSSSTTGTKAKAITEWELRRKLRKEKRTKNDRAGEPPAQAKGGRPTNNAGQPPTSNTNINNRDTGPRRNWEPRPGRDSDPRLGNSYSPRQGPSGNYNEQRRSPPDRSPNQNPNNQGNRPMGPGRQNGNPLTNRKTYMGRPLKEGAPPPPIFVPREQFMLLPPQERDRVQKERDEYIRRWLIS